MPLSFAEWEAQQKGDNAPAPVPSFAEWEAKQAQPPADVWRPEPQADPLDWTFPAAIPRVVQTDHGAELVQPSDEERVAVQGMQLAKAVPAAMEALTPGAIPAFMALGAAKSGVKALAGGEGGKAALSAAGRGAVGGGMLASLLAEETGVPQEYVNPVAEAWPNAPEAAKLAAMPVEALAAFGAPAVAKARLAPPAKIGLPLPKDLHPTGPELADLRIAEGERSAPMRQLERAMAQADYEAKIGSRTSGEVAPYGEVPVEYPGMESVPGGFKGKGDRLPRIWDVEPSKPGAEAPPPRPAVEGGVPEEFRPLRGPVDTIGEVPEVPARGGHPLERAGMEPGGDLSGAVEGSTPLEQVPARRPYVKPAEYDRLPSPEEVHVKIAKEAQASNEGPYGMEAAAPYRAELEAQVEQAISQRATKANQVRAAGIDRIKPGAEPNPATTPEQLKAAEKIVNDPSKSNAEASKAVAHLYPENLKGEIDAWLDRTPVGYRGMADGVSAYDAPAMAKKAGLISEADPSALKLYLASDVAAAKDLMELGSGPHNLGRIGGRWERKAVNPLIGEDPGIHGWMGKKYSDFMKRGGTVREFIVKLLDSNTGAIESTEFNKRALAFQRIKRHREDVANARLEMGQKLSFDERMMVKDALVVPPEQLYSAAGPWAQKAREVLAKIDITYENHPRWKLRQQEKFFIENNVITPEQAAKAAAESGGEYMHRMYEFFENPKYARTMTKKYQKWMNALAEEPEFRKDPEEFLKKNPGYKNVVDDMSPDMRQRLLHTPSILDVLLPPQNIEGAMRRLDTDLSLFIERTNPSGFEKQLLGEVRDGVYILAKTEKLSDSAFDQALFMKWADDSKTLSFATEQEARLAGVKHVVQVPETNDFFTLAGKYVSKFTMDELKTALGFKEDMGYAVRFVQKINNQFRWARVVSNVTSAVQDFASNTLMAYAYGVVPVKDIALIVKSGAEVLKKGGHYQAFYERGLYSGMGSDMEIGRKSLEQMFKHMSVDAGKTSRFVSFLKDVWNHQDPLSRTIISGRNMSDIYWRTIVAESHMRSGHTVDEAVAYADHWVYGMQRLPTLIKVLRETGWPFLGYTWFAAKRLPEAMIRRPVQTVAATALLGSFAKMFSSNDTLNIGDQATAAIEGRGYSEVKRERQFSPGYSVANVNIPGVGRVDLSRSTPYGPLLDFASTTSASGKPLGFPRGLYPQTPLAGSLLIASDVNPRTYGNLRREGETTGDLRKKQAVEIWNQFAPWVISTLPRQILRKTTEQEDIQGKKWSWPQTIVAATTGFKQYPSDPEKVYNDMRMGIIREMDAAGRSEGRATTPGDMQKYRENVESYQKMLDQLDAKWDEAGQARSMFAH